MTAHFTDLTELATQLRALTDAQRPVVLDESVLNATTVAAVAAAFCLPAGDHLTVSGIASADAAAPSGGVLTLSTGTAPALKQTAVPVTLAFWIKDGVLQLSVTAAMPGDWTFTDSFPGLTLFPFDVLPVSGAHFVWTTVEQSRFAWPGDSGATADLKPGLNLLCRLGLGGAPQGTGAHPALELVSTLLGSVIGQGTLRAHGPFAPTKGQVLPVGTLSVAVGGGQGFSIGHAPYTLSLSDPRVAVRIGIADATHPVQDVDLLIQGLFQHVLDVSVAIPSGGGGYQVSTRPLPHSGSITTLIESLPGGSNITQYLPAELSTVFSAVGLDTFALAVSTTPPAVGYLGVSLSTLEQWTLIPGLLVLDQLRLVVETVDPTGMNRTSVEIAAQAGFLPDIFPDPFDITVELEHQSSWDVTSVSGSHPGAVKLGPLLDGLLVTSNGALTPDVEHVYAAGVSVVTAGSRSFS